MKVYKEFEEIAKDNEKREWLRISLNTKFVQTEDLDLSEARLIRYCEEKDGHLYSFVGTQLDTDGLVDDEYYCYQRKGYEEDEWYGRVYFATEEKGTFVVVPFAM